MIVIKVHLEKNSITTAIDPGLIGPISLFQSLLEQKIICGLTSRAGEESGQCCSKRPICFDKYPSATGSYQDEDKHFIM